MTLQVTIILTRSYMHTESEKGKTINQIYLVEIPDVTAENPYIASIVVPSIPLIKVIY